MNLFQSFALYIIVIVIGCSLLGCTSIIGDNNGVTTNDCLIASTLEGGTCDL